MDAQLRSDLGRWIDELRRIGTFAEGGLWRQPFTDADRDAKRLLAGWMEAAKMTVYHDNAGNMFGRSEGRSQGPVLMTGSHIDSVKSGGHLDGALGILAGLAVAAGLRRELGAPVRPIEVVAICGEEQSRFRVPFMGSRAMVGDLKPAELEVTDAEGISLREAIRRFGLDPDALAGVERDDIDYFLELHIEQGPVLEAKGVAVGVVTDIVGITQMRYTFHGDADHGGTTPMGMRHDAVRGAVTVIQKVPEICAGAGDRCVATVGSIEAKPGGISTVPAECSFSLDVRDVTLSVKQGILRDIDALAQQAAAAEGLTVTQRVTTELLPTPMDGKLCDLLQAECEAAGISHIRMHSGAGHDAMILARKFPSAMIFLQSKGGKSHTPKEDTSLDDIMPAVEVLYRAMKTLAYS